MKIKVALEYFYPWTNSGGFYYSQINKIFENFGFDIEFVLTEPLKGDAVTYLSQQEVDFAICPTNRLFVRCDKGEPLVGIAAINHTGLESIQTLKKFKIQRPKDLENHSIALNPTPRGVAMLKHLVEQDGGNFELVNLIDLGTRELTPEDLDAGLAHAIFGGYWVWEALMTSRIPKNEQVVLPVSQWNAPRYHSYVLSINKNNQKLNEVQISQFLKALRIGYLSLQKEPTLAVDIYEKVIPYFPKILIKSSLEAVSSTWFNEAGDWGIQSSQKHQEYAEWLYHHKIIENPNIWKSATTNIFLNGDENVN